MPDNNVALIVGAGSLLGQQIARGLAQAGLRVALNDLLPNHVEALASELAALGKQAAAYPADLSRKLALQTVLQTVLEAWERIDILIFIPVAQPVVALLDLDEWDWHHAVDQNLTAAFLCMQSVGRVMRELGGGVIVNVIGDRATGISASAAEGGLAALSLAAVEEFSSHNIRVHMAKPDADAILALCLQQQASQK